MNKELLAKYGIDCERGLERYFNDEEFYSSLLRSFLSDRSFSKILSWHDNHDYNVLFQSAHELKGASGNINLTEVFRIASKLADSIRKPPYPSEDEIDKLIDELGLAVEKAKQGIETLVKND